MARGVVAQSDWMVNLATSNTVSSLSASATFGRSFGSGAGGRALIAAGENAHLKASASSLATRPAVIWLGSPRSSFRLDRRCLSTQPPSCGSSAQIFGTLQSPCSALYTLSLAICNSQLASFRPLTQLKPSWSSFAARAAVIPLQGSPRSSFRLHLR